MSSYMQAHNSHCLLNKRTMKVVFKQGSGDLFKEEVRFFSTTHKIIILCPQKKLLMNLVNASTAEERPFLICPKINYPMTTLA